MRASVCLSAMVLVGCLCGIGSAQITGKVILQGDAPDMPEIKAMQQVAQCAALHKDPVYEDSILVSDKNELQNTIVFIKFPEGHAVKGSQIEKPAELDQKGCMYHPHVLAVETGQPVIVKNSDPFLHNVHALSIDNAAFNFAQVTVSQKPIPPFTTPETFQVKCDVHPWMKAVIRVFDNPYFSVSNDSGDFSIDTKGLPDGKYTVQAWHEVYKDSAPQEVEVKNGKIDKPLQFKYDAKSSKAEATPFRPIILAAADGCPACAAQAQVASAGK